MMQFKDIVMERYATRGFDRKKIPDDQVKALQELIRYAPSSYNVQPWRVVVISDNERKKTLLDAAWKQPQVTSCSHLFVFCANTELEACTDRLENELKEAGVPQNTITGFIGMIRGFLKSLSPDARLPWAQRQTYIAQVVWIEIPNSSPLYDFDYHRYNAWKRELIPVMKDHPEYSPRETYFDQESQVELALLERQASYEAKPPG